MNSIGASLSSIQAASARLDNAANNIANLNTPGFIAQQPAQSSSEAGVSVAFSPTTASANPQTSNVDLPAQIVELITDKFSVASAAAVIQTQDSLTQSALDIRA